MARHGRSLAGDLEQQQGSQARAAASFSFGAGYSDPRRSWQQGLAMQQQQKGPPLQLQSHFPAPTWQQGGNVQLEKPIPNKPARDGFGRFQPYRNDRQALESFQLQAWQSWQLQQQRMQAMAEAPSFSQGFPSSLPGYGRLPLHNPNSIADPGEERNSRPPSAGSLSGFSFDVPKLNTGMPLSLAHLRALPSNGSVGQPYGSMNDHSSPFSGFWPAPGNGTSQMLPGQGQQEQHVQLGQGGHNALPLPGLSALQVMQAMQQSWQQQLHLQQQQQQARPQAFLQGMQQMPERPAWDPQPSLPPLQPRAASAWGQSLAAHAAARSGSTSPGQPATAQHQHRSRGTHPSAAELAAQGTSHFAEQHQPRPGGSVASPQQPLHASFGSVDSGEVPTAEQLAAASVVLARSATPPHSFSATNHRQSAMHAWQSGAHNRAQEARPTLATGGPLNALHCMLNCSFGIQCNSY